MYTKSSSLGIKRNKVGFKIWICIACLFLLFAFRFFLEFFRFWFGHCVHKRYRKLENTFPISQNEMKPWKINASIKNLCQWADNSSKHMRELYIIGGYLYIYMYIWLKQLSPRRMPSKRKGTIPTFPVFSLVRQWNVPKIARLKRFNLW